MDSVVNGSEIPPIPNISLQYNSLYHFLKLNSNMEFNLYIDQK